MKDKTELIVSLVLQVGVAISAATILLGLLLFFTNHSIAAGTNSYHSFTSTAYSFPHTLSSLERVLKIGKSVGIIVLGLLLIIFTPIMRVATSVILFLRQKDRPMTLVTLFVLAILISSFFLGGVY